MLAIRAPRGVRHWVVTLILAATGCGGDSAGPAPVDPAVGTWDLLSVDGSAVPARITVDPLDATFHEGTTTFEADGTMSWDMEATDHTLRIPGVSPNGIRFRDIGSGKWSKSGSDYTIIPDDENGCTDTAKLEGNTFRVPSSCAFGVEVIWQKR